MRHQSEGKRMPLPKSVKFLIGRGPTLVRQKPVIGQKGGRGEFVG